MPVAARQVASAIDVVVQMTRFTDGRRGLTEIAEVLPLDDDGRYQLAEMFKVTRQTIQNRVRWCGLKPKARGGAHFKGRKDAGQE